MIVDTSALVAILLNEPEADSFIDLLLADAHPRISAGNLLETQIVAAGYHLAEDLPELIDLIGAEIIAFDEHQIRLAFEAFLKFGKDRHPAGLNFGDCFAYAAARALDEPLLFKGNDFSKTDVRAAAEPG